MLREHPGGLPIAQVTDRAVQILEALSAAHRHGVVHRDIKPANLFLTDDARVKICDFGDRPSRRRHQDHRHRVGGGHSMRATPHSGSHIAGVVMAAGCFIAANFLPIGSGYWTDKSSGLQRAQVTLTFNLAHPWTRPIATGPDGPTVPVAQSLAPFLGIGTAAMLALAVIFPLLLRSADPNLKATGKNAYKLSLIRESLFAVILLIFTATNVIKVPEAGTGLYQRGVPQAGGSMLFAASVIAAETLRRTERRTR